MATAAAKAVRVKLAVPQFKDTTGKPTDFNDLAMAETLAFVKEQIEAAAVPAETDADTYKRLAALSPADYDRFRQNEADALGIRLAFQRGLGLRLRGRLARCHVDITSHQKPNRDPCGPRSGTFREPTDQAVDRRTTTISGYLALPIPVAERLG